MVALGLVFFLASGLTQASQSWDIHSAAHLPEWLRFHIDHRTRYEAVTNGFRRNARGGDQVLAFRTNVFLEINYEGFRIGGEFIDSAVTLDDAGTPINTTQVDRTDLLQAYIGWSSTDLAGTGLSANIQAGRQTIDYGSRRLFARNRFRNTVNTFSGLDASLSDADNWRWRSFFVLPVLRLPNDRESIDRGIVEFDEANTSAIFTGTFLGINKLPFRTKGEVYLYYLNENDSAKFQTTNRRIFSPGLRWFRKPRTSEFDFELETIVQIGRSRATRNVTDTTDLDHFSYLGHAALGYSFDLPWRPRFILQYDYASGDKTPNDGKNGRFQTFFGARRFEYGPTGIWGAFARGNVNSPGYRIKLKPMKNLSAFLAHRAFWLAEKRDTWVGANLRDRRGRSGDFIGHQMEIRIRWKTLPKLLTLETGWAHLFKGQFAKNAPGSPADKSDSDYFYVQTKLHF